MDNIIKRYHDFLISNGFGLSRDDEENVISRGTSEPTLEFISTIENVSNILEIGRNNGYSFGFFRFCFPKARVVSVDIVERPTAIKVSKLFDNNFQFINGASDKLKGVQDIFDVVFIDGEHTFKGCKKDWENIQSHINQNSIVVFDDLDYRDWGVEKFFNTINKEKYIKYIDNNPMYGVVYAGQQAKTRHAKV